jgi:hypothetical protein
MSEEVFAAALGRDEAEAFAFIEPFHGSGLGCHVVNTLVVLPRSTCSRSAETQKEDL